MGNGRDQTSEQKKDPPLQKPQGWGTLRVLSIFGDAYLRSKIEARVPANYIGAIKGRDRIKAKEGQQKDPPLQKPQGWGTLRVLVFWRV
jgi:hypothetical protein